MQNKNIVMLNNKVEIQTNQGVVVAELLNDYRIKLTGNLLRCDYSIMSLEHIAWGFDFYRPVKSSSQYKIYETLYLLLVAPAGNA